MNEKENVIKCKKSLGHMLCFLWISILPKRVLWVPNIFHLFSWNYMLSLYSQTEILISILDHKSLST